MEATVTQAAQAALERLLPASAHAPESAAKPRISSTPTRPDRLWDELGKANVAAYKAMWELVAQPEVSVALIKQAREARGRRQSADPAGAGR